MSETRVDKFMDWVMFEWCLWPLNVFRNGWKRVAMAPICFVWFAVTMPLTTPVLFVSMMLAELIDIYNGE